MQTSICQLNKEPFYQCCCNCQFHLPVHHRCCTTPKPTEEQKEKCSCGEQKGWACVVPGKGIVYDSWPEHSSGCEFYISNAELIKIEWTSNRPSTVGWYWTKSPESPPVIVAVRCEQEPGKKPYFEYTDFEGDKMEWLSLEYEVDMDAQWWGPICPPPRFKS